MVGMSVKKERGFRWGAVVGYVATAVVILGGLAFISAQGANGSGLVAGSNGDPFGSRLSVNQITEVDVVANLAEAANLPIAANAANISTSLSLKQDTGQTDDESINKPQVLNPAVSRGIRTYVVAEGESLADIAARSSVSVQTLRWANGLKNEDIETGKEILIPAVDGVVYVVKEGDTVQSLAEKYKSDADLIVAVNDLEVSGLEVGMRVILPNGELPETERPEYVAPPVYVPPVVQKPTFSASSGNGYAYGYCTWYAYERRAALGRPIGGNWGNATSWYYAAQMSGFATGLEPQVGAVMHNYGGFGHVMVVESVVPGQSVTVSEMNARGWNVTSSRTFSWAQATGGVYHYIY